MLVILQPDIIKLREVIADILVGYARRAPLRLPRARGGGWRRNLNPRKGTTVLRRSLTLSIPIMLMSAVLGHACGLPLVLSEAMMRGTRQLSHVAALVGI